MPENIYVKEMLPHIMQLHNEYNAFGTIRQKPTILKKQGESSLNYIGRFAGKFMFAQRLDHLDAYMQLPCALVRRQGLSSTSRKPSG